MSLNHTKKKKLCVKCQACCKILAVPTPAPSKDAMEFYKARGCRMVKYKGVNRLVISHTCPQLAKDGCKIYSNRPLDCQEFDGRRDLLVGDACLWTKSNQGIK
jgi:Fe-S-cluster containining protein